LKRSGAEFTTIQDDRTSFETVLQSMTVLIWFMIGCALVLGFTVLYSVGLISLSAREHEYMFMGVMGYAHGSVLRTHIKETAMQLALALPLGVVVGNLLLRSTISAFSGNNFVIAPAIYPVSYALSALSVLLITALMTWITARHIGRLDIVEGLKAQEE
jgi:putative ABC transport system permease protein